MVSKIKLVVSLEVDHNKLKQKLMRDFEYEDNEKGTTICCLNVGK